MEIHVAKFNLFVEIENILTKYGHFSQYLMLLLPFITHFNTFA